MEEGGIIVREILCRGKRFEKSVWDETDWVYGSLIDSGNHEQVAIFPYRDKPSTMSVRQLVYAEMEGVRPETVGQFTGLTDKNGQRIFEGDILQVVGRDRVIDHCIIGFGKHEALGTNRTAVGFYLYWKNDKNQYHKYANLPFWLEEREAVCVGNIHDNPELLASKEE